MTTYRLTDAEIVGAKFQVQYPPGTYLTDGVTDMDRRIADAATKKAEDDLRAVQELWRRCRRALAAAQAVIRVDDDIITGWHLIREIMVQELKQALEDA